MTNGSNRFSHRMQQRADIALNKKEKEVRERRERERMKREQSLKTKPVCPGYKPG